MTVVIIGDKCRKNYFLEVLILTLGEEKTIGQVFSVVTSFITASKLLVESQFLGLNTFFFFGVEYYCGAL